MLAKATKPKRCSVCREPFIPMQSFQTWCSVPHAVILADKKLVKIKAAKAAVERKADREAREKKKNRGQWLTEAQTEFNKFIRARDAGKPCICCGKPFEPQKPGGSADAGHYLSRGAAPHLRFVENNVHAQRKNCNRPGGTTRIQFRAGMIERIGLEAVEALEADQTPRHYTIEDLKTIKAKYTAMARELRARNQT